MIILLEVLLLVDKHLPSYTYAASRNKGEEFMKLIFMSNDGTHNR